ncbi:hypothetical protein NIES4073_70220 [Kalymmatonema gypsitolerans NIES-4073]|nr:hypothetical protein NIES4073_70220 [Scytonema sp. NIES-4073]
MWEDRRPGATALDIQNYFGHDLVITSGNISAIAMIKAEKSKGEILAFSQKNDFTLISLLNRFKETDGVCGS